MTNDPFGFRLLEGDLKETGSKPKRRPSDASIEAMKKRRLPTKTQRQLVLNYHKMFKK